MADEDIYNKHRDDLIRYATALVGRDRAEDVLSTVIVRVLGRGGLARLDEPRPYLFRAVLNESRTVLGRRAELPMPDRAAELGTADVDLLDAVLRLPVRQRAAVFLVYWEGHTIGGAAELMGAATGTVKRYLHLARRRLREVL